VRFGYVVFELCRRAARDLTTGSIGSFRAVRLLSQPSEFRLHLPSLFLFGLPWWKTY